METRLLARLIDAARTVVPITALTATPTVPSQLATGDGVRAEVAAQLADGRFRVLVAGKPLVLNLPTGIKTGDVVQLRVLEGTPSTPGTPNTPRLQLVLGPVRAAPDGTNVSSAGRLVGALVSEPAGPPLRQAQPIVDVPTVEPSELTGPLARAIERSGLFYESHQARWIGGDYALERLREEPQADARTQRAPAESAAETPSLPLPPRAEARLLPALLRDTAIATNPANVTTQDTVRDSRADEVRSDVAARETLPIVRQQLETLETRNLTWLGEIWPGQAMRWEISDDRPENADEADPSDWSTRFGLSLPALGDVGATLIVTPKGVRIALSAHAQETVATMRTALPDLAHALTAAGVAMAAIQVTHGDSPV